MARARVTQVIVRCVGDKTLADIEWIVTQIRDKKGRMFAPATIRKHCAVVTTDPPTGRQLYDIDASRESLRDVRGRSPHRRRQRGLTNDRI